MGEPKATDKAAEKEIEPTAVTYADVVRAYPKDVGGAQNAWRKIGEITGAGHVPASDDASIDITGIAESKAKHIDAILKPKKEGN